jgi:hypothetical protein
MSKPMIPAAVRSRLEYHMGRIERANQAIRQTRQIEAAVGSPGRYEWEYRTTSYPDLEPTLHFFAEFERVAQDKGIDPEEVYQEYGGKPEPLPWSVEALKWMQPVP